MSPAPKRQGLDLEGFAPRWRPSACAMLQDMTLQTRPEEGLSWSEAAAALYLLVPVFLFMLLYINAVIAAPACVLMAWCAWEICRRVSFPHATNALWRTAASLAIAFLCVAMSGSFGVSGLNSDWFKHFAVLNFIASSTHGLEAGQDSVLRYYLAWYLVPGLLGKFASVEGRQILVACWSTIGTFLFFRMLLDLVNPGKKAIIGALVFVLFSGADIVGEAITGWQRGPRFHHEWWSGWINYNSNMTALFWAPQHTIAAWLMAALMLGQSKRRELLPYLSLLFCAVAFWSPFVAAGLVPFGVYLLLREGGPMLKNWRTWGAIVTVGLPIALYLTTDAQRLPASFQWNLACVENCFSWTSYVRFVALEALTFLVILVAWKPARTGFLVVTAAVLLLFPFYYLGLANDFGMRATMPALAVLAIASAHLVVNAPLRFVAPMVVVLVIGSLTPLGEIYRGLTDQTRVDPRGGFEVVFAGDWASARPQYFARPRAWLMRSTAAQTVPAAP